MGARPLAKLSGANDRRAADSARSAVRPFGQQPIQFYVRGSDMDELVRATDALKAELGKVHGLRRPRHHVSRRQARACRADRPRAPRRVSAFRWLSVASTIRALMAGDAVSELKDGVDVYDITMQLPEAAQARSERLPT